jgi:hypothetical protein
VVEPHDIPWLRQLVDATLDEDEIRDLVQDEFPKVHDRFTKQMDRGQLVRELVSWCNRQRAGDKLSAHLQSINPNGFRAFHRNRTLTVAVRFADLGDRVDRLLTEPDVDRIVDEVGLLRTSLLEIRRNLDDDQTWESMGPSLRSGTQDPEEVRDGLVRRTIRVLSAADYLLTIARREDPPELSALGELHGGRTQGQLGRIFAARTHLVQELRRLWNEMRSHLAA